MLRWDETWHRLREWTNGQAPSERLATQILLAEGYENVDPSHPLGGKDGGKDAICWKEGKKIVMAVYFPRGQQDFKEIEKKFTSDLEAAKSNAVDGIVFVTNQELRLAERSTLIDHWIDSVDLYHLERLTAILDSPSMSGIRKQFLNIDSEIQHENGIGGEGGSGTITGNRGKIIGGRGGRGGTSGIGGKGGGGIIQGDDGIIVGGDGGDAPSTDGRGGRGASSPLEHMGYPTNMWGYGRGGAGVNDPEYDRRIVLLKQIRLEYMKQIPEIQSFIDAGIEQVPIQWVNKRLEELNEGWRVEMGQGGYILPPLARE